MKRVRRSWIFLYLLSLAFLVQTSRADLLRPKKDESAAPATGRVFPMHLKWSRRVQLDEPFLDSDSILITSRVHYTLPGIAPLFEQQKGGLYLSDSTLYTATPPFNLRINDLKTTVEMDPAATYFTVYATYKGNPVAIPQVLTIKDYVALKTREELRKQFKKATTDNLQAQASGAQQQSFELIGADIAGQRVSLRVKGEININGNVRNEKRSQQLTTNNQYQATTFQIKQTQRFKIEGKVGDRVSINVDQDSERDFNFENALEISYTGNEDEIVQSVEAGNISLNLPGTKLALNSGSNQGLFGLKSTMKVGALNITTIASLEQGQHQKKSFNGDEASSKVQIQDWDRLRNQYFFVNEFYRRKFYPLSSRGEHFLNGRMITDIEVYKSISQILNQNDAEVYWGYAAIDTQQVARNFIRLIKGTDYVVDENLGFISLSTPVQTDEMLAIGYRDSAYTDNGALVYEYNHGLVPTPIYSAGTYGTPSIQDTLHLAMIKSDEVQPGQPPWDLEFKNAYYLKARPITKEGFDLKLQYTNSTEPLEEAEDGKNFLQLFGLDKNDVSGNPQPDGIVDVDNPNIIDFNKGVLFLPYLNPFLKADSIPPDQTAFQTNAQNQPVGVGGNSNLDERSQYQSASFYNSLYGTNHYQDDNKFRFSVKYTNRSANLNLGFNVIEGSEEVTLAGKPLQKNVDYSIDYFSGTLTILNQAALAPGAPLEVKYELHEFFQLDKKVILGNRAEYKFGKDQKSFIGATVLYFSKSSIDDKVRIGKEPIQNFIWDVNTNMSYDLNWLTKAIDWLPIIKTDKPSSFSIQGEFAQVRPNPNTSDNLELNDRGVAYIDDFEGSRRETNLGVRMSQWTLASPPIESGTVDFNLKNNHRRSFTYWYNPYNRIPTNEIWPNKETSAQAQNDVTDVLVLSVNPDSSFAVRDDGQNPRESWGGVMRAISSGYYDQSESKFLEMWVKGDVGQLHVDLGQITEDLQSDSHQKWTIRTANDTVVKGWNQLDTEDLPSATSRLGDGIVTEQEDVGLDGWVYTHRDTLDWHPGWDRWAFSPNATVIDYTHANGGEGNFNSEGGRYPDSEDLNGNNSLDLTNAYYTIAVNLDPVLANDNYIAGKTKYSDGRPTGWKLIRVPLTDFQISGASKAVTWQKIKYARIWLDNLEAETKLQIATVDLVGNEWTEMGVFALSKRQDVEADSSTQTAFDVSVINTEDNPNRYSSTAADPYSAPPAGVRGIQDPITGLRSKEQSLVMKVSNLQAGQAVMSRKKFYDQAGKDLSHYATLKIFVHGWDKSRPGETTYSDYTVGADSSKLEFFLRLTFKDENQFYEIRKPVYPGWDKRNDLKFHLADLSNFKLALADSIIITPKDNGGSEDIGKNFVSYDTLAWNAVPVAKKYAEKRLPSGETIVIRGDPSISKVYYIRAGIRNRARSAPMTGEVWLDELRVTDVERVIANAAMASANFQLADLGAVNVSLTQRSADFHNAQDQFGNGQNTFSTTLGGNLNLNKFLPEHWGLSIPLSGSYSYSKKQPKYLPGGDIRIADLDPSLRDTLNSITDLTRSYNWSVSLSKRGKSDFWLTKYTVDNMKLTLSNNQSFGHNSRVVKSTRNANRGAFSYALNLGNKFNLKPLSFMKRFPLVGEMLSEFTLGYLPSSIKFNLSANENQSYILNRTALAEASNSHSLSLTRNVSAAWPLMPTLTAQYSRKMDNNLDSLAEKKADIFKTGNLGHLGNLQESYSLSWSPKLITMLSPSLSYSTGYAGNDPINHDLPGVNTGVNSRASTSMTLKLSDIIGLVYTPAKKPNQPPPRGGPPGRAKPANKPQTPGSKPDQDNATGHGSMGKVLDGIYAVVDRIDPISISVNQNQQVQNSRLLNNDSTDIDMNGVDWRYRLGLIKTPGDYINAAGVTKPGSQSKTLDLSLRSGVKIASSINATLSYNQSNKSSFAYGSDGVTVTKTSDYFPSGKLFGAPDSTLNAAGRNGLPCPSFNIRWNGLEKIKWLKGVVTSMYMETGYRGSHEITYKKTNEFNGETINTSFSPLLGINATFKPGINFSFNWANSRTIRNNPGGLISHKINQTLTSNATYSRRSGITIPLPFMDDFYLENNINFRFEFSYTSNQTISGTLSSISGTTAAYYQYDAPQYDTSWYLKPSIDYSFSDKITGNVGYQFIQSNQRVQGKTNTHLLNFGVKIQIKG